MRLYRDAVFVLVALPSLRHPQCFVILRDGRHASDAQHVRLELGGDTVDQISRNVVCLLYTSDAADERSSVDLGGRRIIKKKKKEDCDRKVTQNKKQKKLIVDTRVERKTEE